ncbi:hypothetical protein E2C01_010312 [Portunus trituberculatus]|uniref:Uncharacterized protein n=1 Tax=Portunus trituberculatus TaxID=210409 RepID=A0A5B7D851_PORTR|nr:hypothetical protein [Portunus trituberculatus]
MIFVGHRLNRNCNLATTRSAEVKWKCWFSQKHCLLSSTVTPHYMTNEIQKSPKVGWVTQGPSSASLDP